MSTFVNKDPKTCQRSLWMAPNILFSIQIILGWDITIRTLHCGVKSNSFRQVTNLNFGANYKGFKFFHLVLNFVGTFVQIWKKIQHHFLTFPVKVGGFWWWETTVRILKTSLHAMFNFKVILEKKQIFPRSHLKVMMPTT